MAKKEAKEAKPKRVKKVDTGEARENYVVINNSIDGDITTRTRAMLIRSVGTMVETTVFHKGIPVSVGTSIVNGVKVKTKKAWKFLIVDKGPKPKKDKKAKK